MKKLFVVLVLLGVGLFVALRLGWLKFGREGATFRSETVTEGSIFACITATGTLEPQEVVDVGTQVNGPVTELGPDPSSTDKSRHINYGAKVKVGDLLARIDPAVYEARLTQAKANLEQANATVAQADATLYQTERDWKRISVLVPQGGATNADYEVSYSKYLTAVAGVKVAKANVAVCKAALKEAETNLKYTDIRSPVDGVIIERRVNIGQTVVASLSAQSLFLIAKDLNQMEIWASVNEADIGHIHEGQKVTFTVPAYPRKKFEGTVVTIRDNANSTSNVVTYIVVVGFDNSKAKLKPYMTASLQFVLLEKQKALRIPNSVLRYRPRLENIAPEHRAEFSKPAADRGPAEAEKASPLLEQGKERSLEVILWVDNGKGFVEPRTVTIGASDNAYTEVLKGLAKGDKIVVNVEHQQQQQQKSDSVFIPKFDKDKSQ
jgi:HlyD family secretion protein